MKNSSYDAALTLLVTRKKKILKNQQELLFSACTGAAQLILQLLT